MAELTERRWTHTIPAAKLHSAIDDYDVEGIKREIISICSKIEPLLEDEYDIYNIQDIKEEAEDIDEFTEEEQIDFILEELYNFCDSTNIWLAPDKLTEENEDKEIDNQETSIEVNKEDLTRIGVASIINTAIKSEWELIDHYNSVIANLISEDMSSDIISIIQSNIDNVTINIGQLEKVLSMVSPFINKEGE